MEPGGDKSGPAREQPKPSTSLDEGAECLTRLGAMFPGRFSDPQDAGDGDWFIVSRGAGPHGVCDVKASLFLGDLIVGLGHFMHTHFDNGDMEPVRVRIQKLFDGEVGALVAYKEDGSWSWCKGVELNEDISESVNSLKADEHFELHFYGGQKPVLSQLGAAS